jgi:hypothetical protein
VTNSRIAIDSVLDVVRGRGRRLRVGDVVVRVVGAAHALRHVAALPGPAQQGQQRLRVRHHAQPQEEHIQSGKISLYSLTEARKGYI